MCRSLCPGSASERRRVKGRPDNAAVQLLAWVWSPKIEDLIDRTHASV